MRLLPELRSEPWKLQSICTATLADILVDHQVCNAKLLTTPGHAAASQVHVLSLRTTASRGSGCWQTMMAGPMLTDAH